MLRIRAALLGKWKGWDHIKGITKAKGAVHIRHTMGSKGRYPRLASKYGLRDGRRHQSNHMRGGLGIKLGGGLFGLRIPRQQSLSTMTKEEYELQMHGHPNITNPYRDHIEEHPDLEGVVRNAALRATFLVALPRVSRQPPSQTMGREEFYPLPRAWRTAIPQLVHLANSLEEEGGRTSDDDADAVCSSSSSPIEDGSSLSQRIMLVLTTTESSVSLVFDEHDDTLVEGVTAAADSSSTGTATNRNTPTTALVIQSALELLYKDHCKGVKVAAPTNAQTSNGNNYVVIDGQRMSIGLQGTARIIERRVQQPTTTFLQQHEPHRRTPTTVASMLTAMLEDKRIVAPQIQTTSGAVNPPSQTNNSSMSSASDHSSVCLPSVENCGLKGWIERLADAEPTALRLQSVLPIVYRSSIHEATPTSHRSPRHQQQQKPSASYVAQGDAKHDATKADALFQWFMFNNDPRAHFTDSTPHGSRPLHVHTVVECVTPRTKSSSSLPSAQDGGGTTGGSSRRSSLIPSTTFEGIVNDKTRQWLRTSGYKHVLESPTALAPVMRKWSSHARLMIASNEHNDGSSNARGADKQGAHA